MTVGILMLHCGLGIRNRNTFYTFRCPVIGNSQVIKSQNKIIYTVVNVLDIYNYVFKFIENSSQLEGGVSNSINFESGATKSYFSSILSAENFNVILFLKT